MQSVPCIYAWYKNNPNVSLPCFRPCYIQPRMMTGDAQGVLVNRLGHLLCSQIRLSMIHFTSAYVAPYLHWSSRRRKSYSDSRRVRDLLLERRQWRAGQRGLEVCRFGLLPERQTTGCLFCVINAFSQCGEITFHDATVSLARGICQQGKKQSR
jgi:hypothetical protein